MGSHCQCDAPNHETRKFKSKFGRKISRHEQTPQTTFYTCIVLEKEYESICTHTYTVAVVFELFVEAPGDLFAQLSGSIIRMPKLLRYPRRIKFIYTGRGVDAFIELAARALIASYYEANRNNEQFIG